MPIAPPMRDVRGDLIGALAGFNPTLGRLADFALPGSRDDPTLGMMPAVGMFRGAAGPLKGPFQKMLPPADQAGKDILVMREAARKMKAMLADMDVREARIRNMLEQYRQIRSGK